MKKLPPTEKIYEAWSAVADGRVALQTDRATVASSNRIKEYKVSWNGKTYFSNDNATRWQGYAGYPIIAVLMLQGRLPLDENIAAWFAGINWTEMNAAAKRDYAKAVEAVFARIGLDEERQDKARTEALKVYTALVSLDIEIQRPAPRKARGSA